MDNEATKIWEHHNPVQILSGVGALAILPKLVPNGRILLITSVGFSKRGTTEQVAESLGQERVVVYDEVTPNPELDHLDAITAKLRNADISSIVALGGGSVLDTGKVLGVTLARAEGTLLDKVFRKDCPQLWTQRLPVTAIPTTSGTGAEVTPFATVWDHVEHKKYSIVGDNVYPVYALLDPVLTCSLPYSQTLYTGLDAISHALESLWNKNCTPLSRVFALQAIQLVIHAFPIVLAEPNNLENRIYMHQASLLAGLSISHTRTAVAHSISYPLTSHLSIPHGLACSFTLTGILNIQRANGWSLWKTDSVLLASITDLLDSLNLPEKIMSYTSSDVIRTLISEMFHPSRADNFNIEVNESLILNILEHVLK